MSDQGYVPAEGEGGEEADVGICCKKCTPLQRKIGYYITFLIGLFLFVLGLINSLGVAIGSTISAVYLAASGIIIILNPLWVKSFSKIIEDMKNPARAVSSLIYVICLVLLILAKFVFGSTIATIILLVLTALAEVWYFLSYFQNGQAAMIQCVKTCCCNKQDGGETQTSS